jgi:hypothetical protein
MERDIAARDAVRRCISNHENLVKFALRAIGEKGYPSVAAELSGT